MTMSSPTLIVPRLMSIEQVSVYVDLSVHTVYRMVSQRRIPFVKIGRLVKFDHAEIDRWIASKSVKVCRSFAALSP
jgi:excisionase family DNA binding protein